jgi:hypothetical protein
MIEINYKGFMAVAEFRAKQGVRYYLQGVHIDGNYLVAMDGSAMGVYELPFENKNPTVTLTGKCTTLLVAWLKRNKKVLQNLVSIEFNESNTCTAIPGDHFTLDFEDCTYPDWRRVMPDGIPEASGVGADYNVDLLVKVQKAVIHLGSKTGAFHIRHNGTQGALVTYGHNFKAKLMPYTKPDLGEGK